jgi:hypothetical protein
MHGGWGNEVAPVPKDFKLHRVGLQVAIHDLEGCTGEDGRLWQHPATTSWILLASMPGPNLSLSTTAMFVSNCDASPSEFNVPDSSERGQGIAVRQAAMLQEKDA